MVHLFWGVQIAEFYDVIARPLTEIRKALEKETFMVDISLAVEPVKR